MTAIEAEVRLVNSSAEVRHTSFAEISPDWVLDSDSYSLTHMKSLSVVGGECSGGGNEQAHDHTHSHDHEHDHDDCDQCSPSQPQPHSASTLSTHSFLIPGIMDIRKLKICLDRLLYSFEDDGAPVVEGEGVEVGAKRTHGAVQKVADILPSEAAESTERTPVANCRIYRMKGVFQVNEEKLEEGGEARVSLHLLQAVHDVFDIQRSDVVPGSDEDKSEGVNKIIVIGKHMSKEVLEKEFIECLV